MPNAVIKKYAQQSGKSVEEVELIWEECKVSAKKKIKDEDKHFYAYVNTCTRNKLGLKPKYSQW